MNFFSTKNPKMKTNPLIVRWVLPVGPHTQSGCFYLSLLDSTELKKWRLFRTDQLRNQYAAGHALLRLLLSNQTGVPADKWRFQKNASQAKNIWRARFGDRVIVCTLAQHRLKSCHLVKRQFFSHELC